MKDLISRQAAIDEMQEYWRSLNLRRKRIPLAAEAVYMDLKGVVATLPSAQPEPEDCGTCKHGYFGDSACTNCRVRYQSHYERRIDVKADKGASR